MTQESLQDFARRHRIPKPLGVLMLLTIGFIMGRAIATIERMLF
ncbi:MAG: hypothetical protein WBA51_03535 [Erythrobacter sp.]